MKTITLLFIWLITLFAFAGAQTLDKCQEAYENALTNCRQAYDESLANSNAGNEKRRSKDSLLAKADLDACSTEALKAYNDCRCGTYAEIPSVPAYILGSNKICPVAEWKFSVPDQENACWFEWKVSPQDNVSINQPSKTEAAIVFPLGFPGGTLEVFACNTRGCSTGKPLTLTLRSDCVLNTQGLPETHEFVPGMITRVYPSQAGDNIVIDYNSSASGKVILNIYDANGSIMMHRIEGVAAGKNSIVLAVSSFTKGAYTAEIIAVDSRSQYRFHVMRDTY